MNPQDTAQRERADKRALNDRSGVYEGQGTIDDYLKREAARAKKPSGEVVLSITQGELEILKGSIAFSLKRGSCLWAEPRKDLLTVIRSQTTGRAGQ